MRHPKGRRVGADFAGTVEATGNAVERFRPGDDVFGIRRRSAGGTFAVPIARALGGSVTAVCSTRNVDQSRALGADRVTDYTQEDFTRSAEPCEVRLDVAGNRSWRDCRRVLAPGGTLVAVGGPKRNRLIGPLGNRLWLKLRSVPGDRR